MEHLVFSIVDTKTGGFGPVFMFAHRAQAFRAFSELARDRTTLIGRHPADFALCEVGTFNDQTGELRSQLLMNHGTAASYVEEPPPELPLFNGEKETV